jgi:hypothetical protein
MSSFRLGHKSFRTLKMDEVESGNIYFYTGTSSLVISIICSMGAKSYSYGQVNFLNCVHVCIHSTKAFLSSDYFENKQFDLLLVKQISVELLTRHFVNLEVSKEYKLTELGERAFAQKLIDEAFSSDQTKIDKELEIIFKGLPTWFKKLPL